MTFLIYWFFFFSILHGMHAYLTSTQKQYIKNIIQNPRVPPEIKNKTKQIIAIHYTPWALAQYNTFIGKHYKYLYKNQVVLNDLRQYALLGMVKALVHYDSSVDFTSYAQKYVLGSLHQGVSLLLPLHPVSHRNRLKGAKLPPITFTNENVWMFDKLGKQSLANYHDEDPEDVILSLNSNVHPYISRKQEIAKIKQIVALEPPHIKRMFYYRYSKYTLEEIRTIDYVSKLMDYSSETYRKHMNKLLKKIKAELSSSFTFVDK